jgi:hypothetical protein
MLDCMQGDNGGIERQGSEVPFPQNKKVDSRLHFGLNLPASPFGARSLVRSEPHADSDV